MTCARRGVTKERQGQIVTFYPDLALTVRAQGNVFSYYLPALYEPAIDEVTAQKLAAQLADIERTLSSLRSTFEGVSARMSESDQRLGNAETNIRTLVEEVFNN
jgi:hypothetical protein